MDDGFSFKPEWLSLGKEKLQSGKEKVQPVKVDNSADRRYHPQPDRPHRAQYNFSAERSFCPHQDRPHRFQRDWPSRPQSNQPRDTQSNWSNNKNWSNPSSNRFSDEKLADTTQNVNHGGVSNGNKETTRISLTKDHFVARTSSASDTQRASPKAKFDSEFPSLCQPKNGFHVPVYKAPCWNGTVSSSLKNDNHKYTFDFKVSVPKQKPYEPLIPRLPTPGKSKHHDSSWRNFVGRGNERSRSFNSVKYPVNNFSTNNYKNGLKTQGLERQKSEINTNTTHKSMQVDLPSSSSCTLSVEKRNASFSDIKMMSLENTSKSIGLRCSYSSANDINGKHPDTESLANQVDLADRICIEADSIEEQCIEDISRESLLWPEWEEEKLLRVLHWSDQSKEEPLTQKEIRDFCKKHIKALKPYCEKAPNSVVAEVVRKVTQN